MPRPMPAHPAEHELVKIPCADGEKFWDDVQEALDGARDESRTTWITEHGERVAAIVPAREVVWDAIVGLEDPARLRHVSGATIPVDEGWMPMPAYGSAPEADGLVVIRDILEALCRRDGLSLDSSVSPGEPARNYELAERLGIGAVFGLMSFPDPPAT
jgi:hypothetical protein